MEKLPYYPYSQYLRDQYGEKVYKLPINLPGTCPNRDGTKGIGGCYFCSELGAGFESLPSTESVIDQLTKNKAYIGQRFKAKKFIAYFQNYTNTYMPVDVFETYMRAACIEDVVELDIATRPDCIEEAHLKVLETIKKEKGVEIVLELGLQSSNNESLKRINRGHDVQTYINAVHRIHDRGFKVCTHLIMNLPWDNDREVQNMAYLMNSVGSEMIKLHSLYIAKGTVFGEMYESGVLKMNTPENYVDRVVDFLSLISPSFAIQRVVGRAPEEETLFCNWGMSWWRIKDMIVEKMLKEGLTQGKMYQEVR